MINSILIFIFGIVSGGVACYFLSKAYWNKRLAALAQSHSAQLVQYDSDLDSAKQQNKILAQRWTEQRKTLEKSLEEKSDCIADLTRQRSHLQRQYEQQLATAKSDRALLQADFDHQKEEAEVKLSAAREKGISLAIEENKTLEAEKRSLQSDIDAINNKLQTLKDALNESVIKNEALQRSLTEQQEQCEHELQQAYKNTGLTLAAVAEMTFPNLVMLRHSAVEIDKHHDHAAAILQVLKAVDNRDFGNSKKVRATNKDWFESKARIGAVRIYFHKDKPTFGQCEILISDKKSQSRDLVYLKNHTS